MRRALRSLIAVLVCLAIGWGLWIFGQMNSEPAQLKFLNWRTLEAPLGILVMIVFSVGVFLSAFVFFSIVISANMERRRLQREVDALRKLVDDRVAKESKSS